MEAQKAYKTLIWQDEDRMSGTICFYGTRIPVSFLFDYIANDNSLINFVRDYRIEIDVVKEVLQLAQKNLDQYLVEVNV